MLVTPINPHFRPRHRLFCQAYHVNPMKLKPYLQGRMVKRTPVLTGDFNRLKTCLVNTLQIVCKIPATFVGVAPPAI